MSRFKIYQIDHYDPEMVGKRIRRLTLILGSIYIAFMLTLQVGINLIHTKSDLALLTAIPFLGLYLYLYLRIKARLKQIKTIGDIEFTRTGIRKRIGDSMTEYDFQTIGQLELQKHIPAVTKTATKSGYFSYILKIVFLDSSSESLIISDKPSDKKQNLSIVDTMKTLKKIIQPEVKIL
jgi:hypothetical protein